MFSTFGARRPEEAPRSGGKVLRERRRAVPAFPYARPENSPLPPATQNRNPRWFSGVITGAGRLFSSVFRSDSGDSSSSSPSDAEGSDHGSSDGFQNADACTQEFNEGDESGRSCKACMMHSEGPQLTTQRSERKLAIEKLLLQESFSRDEGDRLIKIIESRVVDTIEVGKVAGQIDIPDRTVHGDVTFLGTQGSLNWRRKFPEGLAYSANYLSDLSPGSSILHASYSHDLCNKAIIEAKKWLENKKTKTSKSGLDCGPCTLNTDAFQYYVEDEAGSPVDIAKSYMRARPPWQSPILGSIGFKSPPTEMVLFKDESPYARSGSFSAYQSLKRTFLATDFDDIRSVHLKSTENPPDSTTFLQAESCQTVDEKNIAVVGTNHDSNSLSAIEASTQVDALADIPEKLAVEDSCPEVIFTPDERAVNIYSSNSLPSSEMRKLTDTSASKAAKLAAEAGCPEAILGSHDEKAFDVNHSTNDEVDTENDKIRETCNLNTSFIPNPEGNFSGVSLNNEISTQTELPPEMETGLESLSAGCDCPDLRQPGAGKDISVGPDSTDFIVTDTSEDLVEAPQMEKHFKRVPVPDEYASLEHSVNHKDARDSVELLSLEPEELASMSVKSPASKCNSDQLVNDSEACTSDAHILPTATQIRQDPGLLWSELLPAFEVKDSPFDMRPLDGYSRAEREEISATGITANGKFSLQPGSLKKKNHDLPTSSNGDIAAVQVEVHLLSSGAPAEARGGSGTSHVLAKPQNGTTMKSIEQMLAENSPNSRRGRGKRRGVAATSRRGRGTRK